MSSVARRVAAQGSAILLGSLLLVGLGTGAALHLVQTRALDRSLLTAARGWSPGVEWEEHGGGFVRVWLVRDGDPRVPAPTLARVARTERPLLLDQDGERVALVPVERHDRGHDHEHRIVAAAAPAATLGRTVGPFAAAYGLLALIVAAGASAGLVATVRAGFRPMDRARREAEGVLGFGTGLRLTEDAPDEVRPLLQAINALLERLDRAWAAQGRFTAEAAHELRTPIASIRGEVEVALRKERTAEAYRQTLGSVLEEAVRLGRIVGSLLALARLDAGEAERSRELVRARDLVQRALATEQATLRAAGCEVTVVDGPDPELEVHAPLVELALANLLRNAAHHAPGAPVRVRVDEAGGEVVFEVADGGPGVAPADAERLFDRFARAAAARRDDPDGLGLGLPLVREVAQRHGGTATLGRSELGGARARFTLRQSGNLPMSLPGGPSVGR
ncbi:MAG: HAMP domain-containing sensor histidine kinase [Myxococcota bacterium]